MTNIHSSEKRSLLNGRDHRQFRAVFDWIKFWQLPAHQLPDKLPVDEQHPEVPRKSVLAELYKPAARVHASLSDTFEYPQRRRQSLLTKRLLLLAANESPLSLI